MSYIDTLPPHVQDNILRVALHAEEAAASRNQPFEMSLDDVAAAIEDFGGSLDDPRFVLPAGLVGPA
jgi:hypothetical protein